MALFRDNDDYIHYEPPRWKSFAIPVYDPDDGNYLGATKYTPDMGINRIKDMKETRVLHGVTVFATDHMESKCVCHGVVWNSCPDYIRKSTRVLPDHQYDCKCISCRTPEWKAHQMSAIEKRERGRDDHTLSARQVREQYQKLTDNYLELKKRVDASNAIDMDNRTLLSEIKNKINNSNLVVDVSSDRNGEIERCIQKNERKVQRLEIQKKRTIIFFLASVPPAVIASAGFALGFAVVFAPALVIMFVALGIGMYTAPVRGELDILQEVLIDQRYEQGKIINASVTGWQIPKIGDV